MRMKIDRSSPPNSRSATRVLAVLAQAVGKNATGRAGADDDEIGFGDHRVTVRAKLASLRRASWLSTKAEAMRDRLGGVRLALRQRRAQPEPVDERGDGAGQPPRFRSRREGKEGVDERRFHPALIGPLDAGESRVLRNLAPECDPHHRRSPIELDRIEVGRRSPPGCARAAPSTWRAGVARFAAVRRRGGAWSPRGARPCCRNSARPDPGETPARLPISPSVDCAKPTSAIAATVASISCRLRRSSELGLGMLKHHWGLSGSDIERSFKNWNRWRQSFLGFPREGLSVVSIGQPG